jgi:hypothetical protein
MAYACKARPIGIRSGAGLVRAVDADALGIEQVQRAERLVALRKQRMLLEGLHEDIGISMGLLASTPNGSHWRSPAETIYSRRKDELRRELWAAQRQVGEALTAVSRAITAAGE